LAWMGWINRACLLRQMADSAKAGKNKKLENPILSF
jgi:hypothetical protein